MRRLLLAVAGAAAAAGPPQQAQALAAEAGAGWAPNQDARFFFANISEWGPRSESFMRAQAEQCEMIGFAEAHLR
eukprot:4414136-Pyramimonas_sp.AAC.1